MIPSGCLPNASKPPNTGNLRIKKIKYGENLRIQGKDTSKAMCRWAFDNCQEKLKVQGFRQFVRRLAVITVFSTSNDLLGIFLLFPLRLTSIAFLVCHGDGGG
jgi:hypothetical protein